jgi:hypothetical protein
MKKFIQLVSLFFLPVIAGFVLMELRLRSLGNDYSYKSNYLDENSKNIQAIFLGNSHVYYGINPVHIKEKSFNASHVSQSLNYDLAILKKYNDRWRNLNYIVIPIPIFSFYYSIEHGIEKWRVKNYRLYYDIHLSKDFSSQFEVFNGKFRTNLYRLRKKKPDITCNVLGFGVDYNSREKKDLIETGQTAAKRHNMILKDSSDYHLNYETLKSIIEFSEQQNAKLLFITCPAYKTYVEGIDQKLFDNTIATIKKLSSGKPNVSYFNFLSDSSFVDQDFYDADHLNEMGAKKLSLKIDSIMTRMDSEAL